MKSLPVILIIAGALSACASSRPPALIDTPGAMPLQASTPLAAGQIALPADTIIPVAAVQEITSIKMVEGDQHMLQVATDISHNGAVIIPRGAPVKSTITWRTGKGIGGKSAKFDITFNSVTIRGQQFALKGKHRQEGKGNTVGALLGSMLISGRSAVISSGQVINAFTAEPIPIA